MAFEYVLWVSPEAYEALYREMVSRGGGSLKAMVREVLLGATDTQKQRAVELAKIREGFRGPRP